MGATVIGLSAGLFVSPFVVLWCFVKPFKVGFRYTSAAGMGGDCGRDFVGETMTSGTSGPPRVRDLERDRFPRNGSLGTCRYCELVPAMAYDVCGSARWRVCCGEEEDNMLGVRDAAVILYYETTHGSRSLVLPTGGSKVSASSPQKRGRCGEVDCATLGPKSGPTEPQSHARYSEGSDLGLPVSSTKY